MVGEGVLHECLRHPDVSSVTVVGRKPCGTTHPNMQEILVSDFFNLEPIVAQLAGFDACLFCLGTSSVGMTEVDFHKITYTLTMNFAETVCKLNPAMVFCYISGSGTDSTEHGKVMWARVKGKTENDLMKLPFKKAYNFRPAYLHPTKGLLHTLKFYKFISWMYPVGRLIVPSYFSTLRELGLAMINAAAKGYSKHIIEVQDIIALSKL